MKINITEAKRVFADYVKNYDINDKKIKIKISHIERVSQIAKNLAISLNLNEEDIELAELIGLLHDIGRFEQVRRYHTFIDKDSVNHGEYGVKVLFEDGLIRKFLKTTEFDEIIRKAILNHNRAKIEEGLTERENLHAKIIRDADKTDIFYVLTIGDKKTIWESDDLSNDIITDKVYDEFINDHLINYNDKKTSIDLLVAHFAYVFDFNYKQSLDTIKQKGYVTTLYNRFKFNNPQTKEKMEKIYNEVIKYMDSKG